MQDTTASQRENLQTAVSFSPPDVTEADVQAVVDVLRSGWLTTGDVCLDLEHRLSDYLGIQHVVALSSGTAALETACAALRLDQGARVGVPTWTFVASALAAVRVGATPVLLDVDPDSLNISPASLAAAVDNHLDALIPVHFGGVPVPPAVHAICRSSNIPVVEDAAHALGALDHRGRVAGKGSAAACYSLYATKNLTCAEGGALATEDSAVADFARRHRLHGLSADAWDRYRPGSRPRPGYDLDFPGIKANLPDTLAALGRSQLARLDAMQSRRRDLVLRYRQHLSDIPGVRPIPTHLAEGGADHLMVVELPRGVERDAVSRALSDHGVASSVHFRPLHHFSWFRDNAAIGPTGTPVADRMAERVLSLPLSSALTPTQVDRVCQVLADALAAPSGTTRASTAASAQPCGIVTHFITPDLT